MRTGAARRLLAVVVLALLGSLLVTMSPAAAENDPPPSDSTYVCVYVREAQFPYIQLRSLPTADAATLLRQSQAYEPVNGHCLRLDPPNVALCTPKALGAPELVWVDQPDIAKALDAGYTFPIDGSCKTEQDQSLEVCIIGVDGNIQKTTLPSADADAAVTAGGYWPTEGKCVDRQPPKYPTCVGDQIVWVTDRPATPELAEELVAEVELRRREIRCNHDTPTFYVCVPAGDGTPNLQSLPVREAVKLVRTTRAYWPIAGHCVPAYTPNVPVCVTDNTGPVLIWVKADTLDKYLSEGGWTPADGSCVDAIRTVRLCVPNTTGNFQLTSVALVDEAAARAGGAIDPTNGVCPAPLDKRLVCWFNGKYPELVQVLRVEVNAKIATPLYWLPTADRGCEPEYVPLTVHKIAKGGTADFEFTLGDKGWTLPGGGSITIMVPFRTPMKFAEYMPEGWAGIGMSCTGAKITDLTINGAVHGTLDAWGYLGADCTITNGLMPTITVSKSIANGIYDLNDQQFPFEIAGVAKFELGDGNTITYTVQPGTHTITEEKVPYSTLTAIDCGGLDYKPSLDTQSVSATLDYGQNLECKFTNMLETVYVEIFKVYDGDTEGFPFMTPFGKTTISPAVGTAFVVPVGGDYQIVELVPDGYRLDKYECNQPVDDIENGVAFDGTTFAGGSMTCVFQNSRDTID
ncbi:MAG: hypothetical protein KDB21_02360 [Acidimicrobiales bacterium]|nr:hypothetical protein [Acidimicrobiales bacterium]